MAAAILSVVCGSNAHSKRALGAGLVVVYLFAAGASAAAQATRPSTPASRGSGFELGQNYPNPFNPETTIPFTLETDLYASGAPVVVTLQIFNLLGQPVAYPIALSHPAGAGVELRGLEYTQPGRYEAFWDGTDQSGRQVSSGIYFMMLTVNGQSGTRKMYVLK